MQNKSHNEKFDTRKTSHKYSSEPKEMIKQNSSYEKSGKCAPDNKSLLGGQGQNPSKQQRQLKIHAFHVILLKHFAVGKIYFTGFRY